MSDKEPRRRKKRKDSQSRKDDVRADENLFMPSKSETKDSDPEVEEEIVVPLEPSSFAKFVFVVLFSGLVLSMSFIFISLHGTEKGAIDIFDEHMTEHTEELSILHADSHDDEHVDSHDEHDDSHLDDEHDNSHLDDEHDEDQDGPGIWSLKDGFKESIQELLPGIGRILSFNAEQADESDQPATEETDETSRVEDDQTLEMHEENTIEQDTSSVLSSTEDASQPEEYLFTSETSTELNQDPEDFTSNHEPISSSSQEQEYDYVSEEPEYKSTSFHEEESDFTTQSSDVTPDMDSYSDSFEEVSTQSTLESTSNDDYDEDSFTEPEVRQEETFPYYEKADITNRDDFGIRKELDELEADLEKSPERALSKSEKLLQLHKESPRLHYIKAQALDKLAEMQRSNKYLEDAIAMYQVVMSLKEVPEQLYLIAGKRAADRMRFRGFMGKSVKLLLEMANKLPENIELKNLVAVGYLMIGQNREARKTLYDVLRIAPQSGFAKVHLGFILKTDDSNYEESIKLMSEGIASREAGVIDGRFYFHLGDALHRVGKQDEAMKVYEDAVKEGLFLSAYQRSLYNVDGLTGKPWWNPFSTAYAPYFKLLEKHWLSIRDEALSIINDRLSGFLPEAEGLQEKGDWKQFELYARGRRVEKNCLKVPKTCELISQMPDAATCKRGQVKFSIMRPLTHVWAHTGPTNCRLRAHLGLVIPEGASIRVANETRTWEEGKILLFDDSFEHEVWHNGNTSRLVLIVDFWHPELTPYQRRSLTPI